MEAKFLKIIVLAAISDGEFQASEKDLIDHLVKSHPIFKGMNAEIASSAMVDIYNKTNAGMEPKYILDQLSPEFDQKEKNTAFALAKEICASDFNILPAETDFLTLIIEQWSIPDEVVEVVNKSIELRYSF